MQFHDVTAAIELHLEALQSDDNNLVLLSALSKEKAWETYLEGFAPEHNKMYRERREHDCAACRAFIRQFGPLLVMDEKTGFTRSVFRGIEETVNDDVYLPVFTKLAEAAESAGIESYFLSDPRVNLVKANFEEINGKPHKWEHFFAKTHPRYKARSHELIGEQLGKWEALRNVFDRALKEFTLPVMDTILELIAQGSLYRGNEMAAKLRVFRQHMLEYAKAEHKDAYAWVHARHEDPAVVTLRNSVIGTLLVDLEEGADLDTAVAAYEKKVAPENYRRPTALVTQAMKDRARETIKELGFMSSLARRFATFDDISKKDVLFSNRDTYKGPEKDIFDDIPGAVNTKKQDFSKVETITADKFLSDVLPTAKAIEVYFERKHRPNLVSLIAPVDAEAPSMFRHGNPFSWAYAGNATDAIAANVKELGGDVDGVLRATLQWSEGLVSNDDLDLHCITPAGEHIYFSKPLGNSCFLDIDIRSPREELKNKAVTAAVENITFPDLAKMKDGDYVFGVSLWANRGGPSAFTLQIAFEGRTFQASYARAEGLESNFKKLVKVTKKQGTFTLTPISGEFEEGAGTSQTYWDMPTNTFVPVHTIMLSPNYWESGDQKGNRHVMFLMQGAQNKEQPNGFFNEILVPELHEHKKALSMLGNVCKVADSEKQLSGLGFSDTVRNEVVVKVKGNSNRVLKVTF